MSRNPPWPLYASSTDRWLDSAVVDAISQQLPSLADEIVRAIRHEVPSYARPLDGDFGREIRSGTELALRRFIGTAEDEPQTTYRRLGYGEHSSGRSLDALQAAYRVGARVAWRRMSHAAAAAGASADAQSQLAEAMFAYIDQLAGESIEGYAEAQLAQAGELERRRGELFRALTASPRPDAETLMALAHEARWGLPTRVACVVVEDAAAAPARRHLSGDALQGPVDGKACLVVPDPIRLEDEARTVTQRLKIAIGLGPSVPLAEAEVSQRWARLAFELARGSELAVAERRLADIALLSAPDVTEALRRQALAPLDGLNEPSRTRLAATLLAWLRHRGSQQATAAELAVHPQTVRYRLRQLRDLFGEALDAPDRRFALEIALRARAEEGRRDSA